MNGWADPEPAWWLNLQAHPDVTIDLPGGETRAVHARAANRHERPRLWARQATYDKDLDGYAARRSRQTAVATPSPRPEEDLHGQARWACRRTIGAESERELNCCRRDGKACHDRGSQGGHRDWRAVHHRDGWTRPQRGPHGRGPTGPAYLAQVAAQPNQVVAGAVLVLIAGFSVAMVPVLFWPIGRRYNETLAMGYVVFRGAIETVIYIIGALGWLLLIPLSTQTEAAPLAGLVRTIETVAWDQLLAIPFALGALMFYVVLYQSRLVPRWLSTWGLVGAVLYIVPPVGEHVRALLGVLMAPLAVQEMVLAVWLIAKGFNPAATAAESAGEMPTWGRQPLRALPRRHRARRWTRASPPAGRRPPG